MEADVKLSRRALLRKTAAVGAAVAGSGWMLVGCGDDDEGEFSCTDTSGLSATELKTRKSLNYTDRSPHDEKRCDNCRYYEAPQKDDGCGSCKLVAGPIHPQGYCESWADEEEG